MHLPSRTALLGIPLDSNSSFLYGPALAPARIRQALHNGSGNYWTERGFNPIEHPNFKDKGTLQYGGYLGIQQAIGHELDAGYRTLCLGGDHSVTYPIMRAYHERFPDLTILQIDAHGDLYDNFMGNRYSHASPFARIMEEGLCRRLVQVGVRTLNSHQRRQAERFGVEILEMKDFAEQWTRLRFHGPLYISLDLDGLDPSCAPGVSHHEPGGLTTRQVLDLLQHINVDVVGADIVEYNPHRDWADMTATVAAKFTKEILELILK
ncbi:MAG: agmatinase family protein [Lewinella sp.]|nr:agmatinase family protein [Lewinella sp.]